MDLAAWSLEIESRQPPADGSPVYDELLARLGLEALPEGSSAGPSPDGGTPTLASLTVTALRSGGGRTPVQLVAARFRGAPGEESLRAQLLRPLPGREHLYCPLGDELSHDKEVYEEPCLERHEGPARSLALEGLVAPDRDAIVVRDAGGWCGPGTSRGDRLSTSFWGVEDGRLVRYLETTTFEAWYQSPAPPVKTRRAQIELSDSWPRVVTVSEVVECQPPAEPATSDDDCEPFASTREYHYIDNRYVVADDSSPTTARRTSQAGEKTTP